MTNSVIKVPEATLIFWIVKIFATTLGETGGDAVSMSLGLGYLTGTIIFAALFVILVAIQIRATSYNQWLYWATIVATTTVGTTLADFCDRSLGIGYTGGSALLIVLLLSSLFIWHKSTGSISIQSITTHKAEMFYWITIMFSQTLGTAFGDWLADTANFGYVKAGMLFGSFLLVLAIMYFFTNVSRTFLFWSAFILTRPLGAVVGDFLDKPIANGGLAMSRFGATAILLFAILILLLFFKQKKAESQH